MHVDASCLTMMDLTTNHCRIGVCLHLKAGYTVPMDVTALKVTLETENDKPIISPSKWFLAYMYKCTIIMLFYVFHLVYLH